ncbi:FAD-linked oxidase [Paractinoplanes deccanensis]|uniref:FAD-linked oxidase n=1 Tax=Paractinoplanes deccanensis TaxID=113561 RepID=A0ABQ3XY14_9ACTN|nr:FAD-binding oxidoreductase [Actinoplanes deccanensis]GID72634.1 FAD-linked oxidase [Actinoplanes deccanensis]
MINNIDRLREQVSVLLPGEPGYAAACATFNVLTPMTPAVVVDAAGPADVQAAVRFAAANGLAVAVKGGGHLQPLPGDGAVLIVMDRMAGVTVDPAAATARVTGSARWGQVLDAAAEHGLAPLNGSTPTVGAIGYVLGGGQSPTLGRRYGYAGDHVTEFEVVTADGQLRVVDEIREPELFHALKGTRGNLGVVTRMDIGLLPIPTIYAGGLFFPGEQMTTLLPLWRDWAATLPENASTSVAVDRLPPAPDLPPHLRGAFLLHVRFAFIGPAEQGAALLAPIRAAGTAVDDSVAEVPYRDSATMHADPLTPLPYVDKGLGLSALTDETLAAFLGAVGPDSGCPLTTVEIRALGGALDRAPAVPDAVPSRGLPFQVFGVGAGGPDDLPRLTAALDRLVEALRPWQYDHQMANFMTVGGDGLRRVYGPELYDRILAVKHKYDPDNLFRVNFTFV